MNKQRVLARSLTWLIQHIGTAIARILNIRSFGRIWLGLFLLSAIVSMSIAACSGTNSTNSNSNVKLKLVSFSVTKAAHDRIIPKFVEKWQKEHNQKVTFEQSYGGSLAQADAVISGQQEADIVHLALPLDAIKIEKAGLIESGWQNQSPRSGVVSRSVAAIVVRKDNPKKIENWADLTKDGVKIIAADPKTSGIAVWQFLAYWGSVTQNHGEEKAALDYVKKIYQNTPKLAKDAREASDWFFQKNEGDALVTYENEVIFAGLNRPKLPYIVPTVNISIDNPVAVVDKNVDKHGTREVAKAFVDFLYSQAAQQEFSKLGYRAVNPLVSQDVALQYPKIDTLFTSQDLGGWDLIQQKFFATGAIFDEIQPDRKT